MILYDIGDIDMRAGELPPMADITCRSPDVRFGSKTDIVKMMNAME